MFIYEIRNKLDNKKLIGQTIQTDPIKRWRSHRSKLRKNIHNNPHLQRAWNKYGETNFEFNIIRKYKKLDIDYLNKEETSYINRYKTLNQLFGYNIMFGGGNKITPLSVRIKISKIKRPKPYPNIVDPQGNIHTIEPTLEEFCRKHILVASHLRNLINKSSKTGNLLKYCRGWHLASVKISMEESRSKVQRTKEYPILVGPDNKEYRIGNFRRFIKQHNLNRHWMQYLVRGKVQQHKGWHIKGTTIIDPNILRSKAIRGTAHPAAKLNEATVLEIRKVNTNQKPSIRALAKQFSLPKTTVWNIIHRKRWTHI